MKMQIIAKNLKKSQKNSKNLSDSKFGPPGIQPAPAACLNSKDPFNGLKYH